MRGFRMSLAAAVTSALVVVGVVALDAVGADKTNASGKGEDPLVGQFAACLRDHGVQVPALQRGELAHWLKTQDVPLAAARACKTALAPEPPVSDDADRADAAKIAACMRSHGLNPPTDPAELKRWIGSQRGAEFEAAMEDCGLGGPPPGCGGEKDKRAVDAAKVDPGAE
jgi:hypothetical protein